MDAEHTRILAADEQLPDDVAPLDDLDIDDARDDARDDGNDTDELGSDREHEPELIDPESDPIATARRRHGAAGAMLAAGMFGIDVALGRKVKQEAPVVVAAATEPVDIETDGIHIPLDDTTSVYAPPQPPTDPFPRKRRR
ncbi:MAG: hypothetical protein Q7V88_16785 [Actinomycetota bacterium]|nr:hypothetical protein [Actinomycetota bacterium]